MSKEKKEKNPRPQFFMCSAIDTSADEPTLVSLKIYFHPKAPLEDREINGIWAPADMEPTDENAASIFKDHKGMEAVLVDGPSRDVMNTMAPVSRNVVSVKQSDIIPTMKIWAAKYGDWPVFAHGLKACSSKNGQDKFEDNEVVLVLLDEQNPPLGPDGKRLPKPRFGPGMSTVRFSALENPQVKS